MARKATEAEIVEWVTVKAGEFMANTDPGEGESPKDYTERVLAFTCSMFATYASALQQILDQVCKKMGMSAETLIEDSDFDPRRN